MDHLASGLGVRLCGGRGLLVNLGLIGRIDSSIVGQARRGGRGSVTGGGK